MSLPQVDLGEDGGGYHSVFACPILRQQASEQNPPMRLLCGHVISRDALNKLAMGAKLVPQYHPITGPMPIKLVTNAHQLSSSLLVIGFPHACICLVASNF